jgi:hypothetical protein
MESKHITYNRLVGPIKTFEGLLGRVLSAATATPVYIGDMDPTSYDP